MSRRLVLATRNEGKVVELQRLLGADFEVVPLDPDFTPGPETAATFRENAVAKAVEAANHMGDPAVADDSGLCVDALGGMPGVLSARWAGRHGDDGANTALLLRQLEDVPDERRHAHFVCAAAYALPNYGRPYVVQARWDGRVTRRTIGTRGFGYDPVFLPDGEVVTSAQLDPAVKDAISHRGQAFRLLAPVLMAVLRPDDEDE